MERFPWEENLPETQTEQWMASCLTECWFTGHTASQRCLCSAEIRFFSQSRAENSSSEQWDLVLMCDFVELMDKDSDRWESKSSFSAWNSLSVWVLIYIERNMILKTIKSKGGTDNRFPLEHEVWSWRCESYCERMVLASMKHSHIPQVCSLPQPSVWLTACGNITCAPPC